MKCLHYLETKGMERVGVKETAVWLWRESFEEDLSGLSEDQILVKYRSV